MKFKSLLIYFAFLLFSINLTAQDTLNESNSLMLPFKFNHDAGRLFSIPTSDVYRSLDLSLIVGGSFGFEKVQGILGSLGLGLGGYGDLLISSEALLGSIFDKDQYFSSIGMKIKILNETDDIPGLAAGIKTNGGWNSVRSGSDKIIAAGNELYENGLRTVDYDSRMTSIFLVLSRRVVPDVKLHAGIYYSDLRYKNVFVLYNEGASFNADEKEQKKNLFTFFGGIDYTLNERTIFMLEVQSFPYMVVDHRNGYLSPKKRIVGVAGLRFFITDWLLIDSGIRYQDNYKGLADAELKIGLNGMWNLELWSKSK